MTLLELARRCEQATGPDRELDVAIALAIGLIREREGNLCYATGNASDYVIERGYYDIDGGLRELPYFTASIDAAMTLVPEGWDRGIGTRRGQASAYVNNGRSHYIGIGGARNPNLLWFECRAATEALALCAAALRARAAQ